MVVRLGHSRRAGLLLVDTAGRCSLTTHPLILSTTPPARPLLHAHGHHTASPRQERPPPRGPGDPHVIQKGKWPHLSCGAAGVLRGGPGLHLLHGGFGAAWRAVLRAVVGVRAWGGCQG